MSVTYLVAVAPIEADWIDAVPSRRGYTIVDSSGANVEQLKAAVGHPSGKRLGPAQPWRSGLKCEGTLCGGCVSGKPCLYTTGEMRSAHQPLAYRKCAECADGDCGHVACSKGKFLCIGPGGVYLLGPDAHAEHKFAGIVVSAVESSPNLVEFTVVVAGLIKCWLGTLPTTFGFANVDVTMSKAGPHWWATPSTN
jgi:hypothetical protein